MRRFISLEPRNIRQNERKDIQVKVSIFWQCSVLTNRHIVYLSQLASVIDWVKSTN